MPQIKHSWVWIVSIWALARCTHSCSNGYNPNSTVLYLRHLSTVRNNLFLNYFSQKIRFDSLQETSKPIFWEKIWKPYYFQVWSAEFALREIKVKMHVVVHVHNNTLTFTTLWAFSADDRLMIFFLFSPENRIWHFMQIVSLGDNLQESSYPVFWEK